MSAKNIGELFDSTPANFRNTDKGKLFQNNTTRGKESSKISLSHLKKMLNQKTSAKQLESKKGHTLRIKNSNSKKFLASTNFNTNEKINQSSGYCRSSSKSINKNNLLCTFPITAAQTLKQYGKEFLEFEKCEILDYDMIYYMGNGVAKLNFDEKTGYDDDNGDYNTYVGEQINYRYEILDILGKGSFGQALKCVDHKNNQLVAVKIIRSKKKFYRQSMVEVKILKYIKDHNKDGSANVIKILDHFMFRKHIVIYL